MNPFIALFFWSFYQVQYECDGFLDKNRDTVFEELINILKASQVAAFTLDFSHSGVFLLCVAVC